MFKVSFKETKGNPTKFVTKGGNNTVVYLIGRVKLPKFWAYVPREIMEWVGVQDKVEIYEHVNENVLEIYSKGISRCKDGDKYDGILGERLAESRAKYHIYKFFYDLTTKLYNYYSDILFGECGIVDNGQGNCIAQCMKKYEALCIRESHHVGELLKSKYNE